MDCTVIRKRLFLKIDGELSNLESEEMDAHLAQCEACRREYGMLTLPGRLAGSLGAPEPSPYFMRGIKRRIEGEAQSAALWQFFLGLERKVVPVLTTITLALVSVFAYMQLRVPETDLCRAYEKLFSAEEQPDRVLVAAQGDITDEGMLSAIAERASQHRRDLDLK